MLEDGAERTLSRARRRELTERDQQALLDLLAQPQGPIAALLRAVRRYQTNFPR